MGSSSLFKEPISPVRPILPGRVLTLTARRDMITARTPSGLLSPRISRTAPAISRRAARRYDLMKLHQITFKENNHFDLEGTPGYDPDSGGSYFEQCFTVLRKVGHGSFGEVYAVISNADHGKYAVKIVREVLKYTSNRSIKHREVKMFEMAPPHENLVAFHKAWEENGRLHIQTELCETNLARLSESYDNIKECDIWHFLIDLTKAVHHLHSNGLIHVDIKPANVMVTKDVVCKLGDFGLMVQLDSIDRVMADEGDCRYLAKEVLNDAPTKAADIFSLGMTILEMIIRKNLPPNGDEWQTIRTEPIPEEMFDGQSDDLKRLIRWMTCEDPKMRPTAEQLLNEPTILLKMKSEPWLQRADKLEIVPDASEDGSSPTTPTTVAKPDRTSDFSQGLFVNTPDTMRSRSPAMFSTCREIDEFGDDDFPEEEVNRRRTFAFERNQDKCIRRLRFDSDDDDERPATPSNTMIYAEGDSPLVSEEKLKSVKRFSATPLKRSISAIKLDGDLPRTVGKQEVSEDSYTPFHSSRYNLRPRKTPNSLRKSAHRTARKLSFESSPDDMEA